MILKKPGQEGCHDTNLFPFPEPKFRHGDNRKTEDIKIEEEGKEQGIRE